MLGLVLRYIALDIGGTRVMLAMIPIVMQIVDMRLLATWCSLMLEKLCQDLHQIVYQGGGWKGRRIGFLTLFQVWAWEHIAVLRPLGCRDRQVEEPVAYS